MDWLDLLAVPGTLKSLLQHHSSKASILWYSVFFMVQLSHPYTTTGKTIGLTIQIFRELKIIHSHLKGKSKVNTQSKNSCKSVWGSSSINTRTENLVINITGIQTLYGLQESSS